MKLTKKQKRYLRENFRHESDAALAKQLGISEDSIRQAFKQLHLKRTEAELRVLQDSEDKKKTIKDKIGEEKMLFFRKPLFFILTGVLAAVLILFFILTRFLPTKEDRYISELEELMSPLDVSELNILFFTLDTTRADHLGCYGYHRAETPNIDRLAETGILFKNTTCQVPLTLPSHSSIFTSTYPFYHGVRDNGGFYLEPDRRLPWQKYSKCTVWLPAPLLSILGGDWTKESTIITITSILRNIKGYPSILFSEKEDKS